MKRKLFSTIMSIAMAFMAAPAFAADDGPPPITADEIKKANEIYFNRCGGCHGTLRGGATGKPLLPKTTRQAGTEVLQAIIASGTPGGMPAWVDTGVLSDDEANLLARYIQQEPVAPPEMSMEEMKKTWKLIVPVEKRPTKPEHKRNWQNFFGVVLRDAGKVALIDGDTKEIVTTLDSGFAVHILRVSSTGRYIYSIGRDGMAKVYDIWAKNPETVAQVKVCTEARSIDTSKYKGFEDKLAVVGCYWPPHFVVLDGVTLEPKKVVSTRGYNYDDNAYNKEPRVAAIVSSHYTPEWVMNIKETGFIWLVDYSDIVNLKITMIEAERFLHDGGWDAHHRYFMAAANKRDTMVVIDTKARKKVAQFKVGTIPHPGRGANWIDPTYGPVTGTVHIGEAKISVWGSDPEKHPKNAWKVLYTIDMSKQDIGIEGGGQLFIKSHPKSNHVWVDLTFNTNEKTSRTQCVYKKSDLLAKPTCFEIGDRGRAVHQEYNKDGTEVWVSLWHKDGAVVVYDDKTLKEKHRITGLETPTGKFNVYNTMNDVY